MHRKTRGASANDTKARFKDLLFAELKRCVLYCSIQKSAALVLALQKRKKKKSNRDYSMFRPIAVQHSPFISGYFALRQFHPNNRHERTAKRLVIDPFPLLDVKIVRSRDDGYNAVRLYTREFLGSNPLSPIDYIVVHLFICVQSEIRLFQTVSLMDRYADYVL